MPRQCQVCVSPLRSAFEVAVDAGMTVRAAARDADVHYQAAARHIRHHGRIEAPRLSPVGPWTIIHTFTTASGHQPMPWQREMLTETRDTLLIKGRQVGATEVASALAIHTARTKPGSTSVIISPSLRQSSEVTYRARLGFWEMGEKLRQDSASLLRLANGSRVISLPGSARGIRGYAADLVILDEASWIAAETFAAARPLTTATGGRLVVQSTPGSPTGSFFDLVENIPTGWAFMKVRSDEVPTISAERLEHERQSMTAELYSQEYEAEFAPGIGGSLFSLESIQSLIEKDVS